MPFEVISLHLGQCGNQLGHQFWRRLCEEHAISPDGELLEERKPGDMKETFFYQADDARYVPRAILFDLEPRVLNTIRTSAEAHLFNQENIYVSKTGGGAGNNWASGYAQGTEVFEKVFDIVDREAENADRLEGFNFTHSISGGTGSGCGSFLLEKLRDKFPKKYIQTYSVFANQTESSDVVVEPYNSVLTLERLIEHPDAVFVLDNSALHRIASESFRVQQAGLEHVNSLVSRIMSASTAPVRFANPMYAKLFSLMVPLFSFPPMRFIQTGFTPITEPGERFTQKTSVGDVLRRLLQPQAMMVSTGKPKPQQAFLSAIAVLQGDYDVNEMIASLQSVRQKGTLKRTPWAHGNPLQIVQSESSPYVKSPYRVSGLLMANHTNMAGLLDATLSQFQRLRARGAFLEKFKQEDGFTVEQMDAAAERVADVARVYREAETEDFIRPKKQ